MIKIFIYNAKTKAYIQEVTGHGGNIEANLNSAVDFTLTPPPDFNHVWRWIVDRWVADEPEVEPIEVLQATVWSNIKNKRLEQVTSGVLVKSINKRFHTDETSTTQYSNIAGMIALNNYEPIQWKVMDNTWVLLTIELFMELQKAVNTNTQVNYEVAEHHKETMLTMSDPMEYDFSDGWSEGIVDY